MQTSNSGHDRVKTLNKLKEVQYGIYKKLESKENERLIEEFICKSMIEKAQTHESAVITPDRPI